MPALTGMVPQSSRRVTGRGRLIKGLYYSDSVYGSHILAVFYLACNRLLEPKPFLVMDFRTDQFSLDGDRDGCVDTFGRFSRHEIDPADFLSAIDQADEICDEDSISFRGLHGRPASLMTGGP